MPVQTKICGINHPDAMTAAVEGGARYVGLVFYPRSPRHVPAPTAAQLSRLAPTGVRVVGLFVEPGDEELDTIVTSVPLDMIQLHGEETPGRVREIRERYGIEVMKAVRWPMPPTWMPPAPIRTGPTGCCSMPSRRNPSPPCPGAMA